MKILAIETSCDETAVSIVEIDGTATDPTISVLSNQLFSQVDIHAAFGGVVPNLAKRAHKDKLLPLLKTALKEAGLFNDKKINISDKTEQEIKKLLAREDSLATDIITFIKKIEKPNIDYIAVTHGPGLEPALWVGINFAKALGMLWDIPVIPINHMEGHIMSVLLSKDNQSYTTRKILYPALALLISGGHTELVYIEKPLSYKIIGQTRDDAVGEAFDKVARLLSLPYPGGPQISNLAKSASHSHDFKLPRPMIGDDNFDFSFSGLKTAVLYRVHEIEKLSDENRADLAEQFELAVTDVLFEKTARAAYEYNIKTLIIGGGVSANTRIRNRFQKFVDEENTDISLLLPDTHLSTDNAIMIALAAYHNIASGRTEICPQIKATGNLSLQ
tara:strand:+ start:45 stop:1211 length:1167 start_codon:yes stop_codon:yes gene_type:complete